MAQVQNLSRTLANNGRYKANRVYAKHPTFQPTKQDWQTYLGGPGHEGGLNAEPIDFDEQLPIQSMEFPTPDPAYEDLNWDSQGSHDLNRITQAMKK